MVIVGFAVWKSAACLSNAARASGLRPGSMATTRLTLPPPEAVVPPPDAFASPEELHPAVRPTPSVRRAAVTSPVLRRCDRDVIVVVPFSGAVGWRGGAGTRAATLSRRWAGSRRRG